MSLLQAGRGRSTLALLPATLAQAFLQFLVEHLESMELAAYTTLIPIRQRCTIWREQLHNPQDELWVRQLTYAVMCVCARARACLCRNVPAYSAIKTELYAMLQHHNATTFSPNRGPVDPAACKAAHASYDGFWGPWVA